MRLALISPTFPPDSCGVGDYAFRLTEAFTRLGVETEVMTSRELEAPGVHFIPRPWDGKALRELESSIARARPDAVLLQYTPQLFAPERRGLHPGLVPWLGRLRAQGVPVGITAHELNYPAGLSPRGLLIGLPQLLQFLGLAAQADAVFFTYEAALERTARRLPWKRAAFTVIPVGTNILPETPAPELRTRLRATLGLAPEVPVWIHFGGMHPTHLHGHMLRAVEVAARESAGVPPVLVFAGVTQEALERKLAGSRDQSLLPRLRGLGYLEPARVSEWLQASDLVLAPFMDGVSTRRGSFMAGLAHGRPIVTTRGWATSAGVPWEELCRIVPVGTEESFGEAVLSWMHEKDDARRIAERGRVYHDRHFAWDRIAATVIQRLEALPGRPGK